jgi:hypothetical protein
MSLIRGIAGNELEDAVWQLGRLEDGEARTLGEIGRGKYLRLGAGALRWPVGPSSRPRSAEGRQTFHWSHGFVSKGRSLTPTTLREMRDPGRVYVFPGRGQVSVVRDAGGRYDRKAGAWHVDRARLSDGSGDAGLLRDLSGATARGRWMDARLRRGVGVGAKASRRTGATFQAYVEREHHGEDRRAEVERDAEGAISIGTIGDTPGERAAFWLAVADRERADGRIQCRIIAELPHEVTPEERRRIVTETVAPLRARGLPFHAAVHRPDVERGMDPRNVHLHIVYHDRPLVRRRSADEARRTGAPRFELAERKDREARGEAWIRALRSAHCSAMNAALERHDRRLEQMGQDRLAKRYDARSYAEMGIAKRPTRHLGPTAAAYEKSGRPTPAGVGNLLIEAMEFREARIRDLAARARVLERARGLVSRASWDAGPVESPVLRRRRRQVWEDLEAARASLLQAARSIPRFGHDRRPVRARWLAREGDRLDGAVGALERRGERETRGPGGLSIDDMRRRARAVAEMLAELTDGDGRGGRDASVSAPGASPEVVGWAALERTDATLMAGLTGLRELMGAGQMRDVIAAGLSALGTGEQATQRPPWAALGPPSTRSPRRGPEL